MDNHVAVRQIGATMSKHRPSGNGFNPEPGSLEWFLLYGNRGEWAKAGIWVARAIWISVAVVFAALILKASI